MAKKILMSVEMRCEKCRSKALKIAAGSDVKFVGLEGEKKDRVVVVGEDSVDAVAIVLRLRNKLGRTDIISVSHVKP
ncbi:PREDICTED: uncharacterized protein LOC104810216 isoform X3 [Tarenaya hassleriana]|uniref:uncharacterized protein LOC104806273 isoform X3 n=1 Tax=Tarenaya hassleriana TaxID=28532 RepID=UPI00053C8933|nr:PREDICTED: uncharacterized protein LOC104806273 isoform X3 [Tarenaya hassleriana]XP_010534713.1 PREDICTED: uncharacterized protein LOC104810216 isoform X3 [Tarenaya hassleriana]